MLETPRKFLGRGSFSWLFGDDTGRRDLKATHVTDFVSSEQDRR